MSDDSQVGQRQVIRHWPTAIASVFVAAICLGGFVPVLAVRLPEVLAEDEVRFLLGIALLAGIAALGVFSVFHSRCRAILDDRGVTVVSPASRRLVSWDDIGGWEIEAAPRLWLIRAKLSEGSIVVLRWRNVVLPNFHFSDGTYFTPPDKAPRFIHRAYDALTRRWDRSRA